MSSFYESKSKTKSRSRARSKVVGKPELIHKTGHKPLSEWKTFQYLSVSQESLAHEGHYRVFCENEFQLKGPQTPKLHRALSAAEIDAIGARFKAHPTGNMTPDELRTLLEEFKIYFTDAEYERFFLKVNTDRDQMCDWDELVCFLILGFEEDAGDTARETLDPPIKEGTFAIKRTRHRHQIARIDFCPTVLVDRTSSSAQGSYAVAAIDGTVNYYSVNWEFQRSGKSPSPKLKIAKTFVTESLCMPDVRIVCVASTERDLRFYDTSANTHSLRLQIEGFPESICAMNYYWSQDITVLSKLILGDIKGTVRQLEFNSEGRGPFRSSSGAQVTTFNFNQLLRTNSEFTITEFKNLHTDKVQQVAYSPSINAIISAAETGQSKKAPIPSVFILDLGANRGVTKFRIDRGVTCFHFDDSNMLVTGGPDWILRLWTPFAPDKPVCTLPGHHAGITFVFMQDSATKIYSVDKVKIIKVWDVQTHSLLQTYIHLPLHLPDEINPFVCFYNDVTRELIIAGGKFVLLKCNPSLRLDLTDGETHTHPVSVVLYNTLFEVVVTCGLDSFIIVWDIWTGTRLNLIKMAHSKKMHGELLRVEITAACFDPKHQLLLTGARDGTLKVWNFNNGFCVRHFSITRNFEVTAVFWVPDRILAVGWNRFVMEFADAGVKTEFPNGKCWDTQHDEEILCAATFGLETVATTSYSGELVFWNFFTGQAYRKFNVKDPTNPIKVFWKGLENSLTVDEDERLHPDEMFNKFHRMHTTQYTSNKGSDTAGRALSIIPLPLGSIQIRGLSIQSVVFLETRPNKPDYGTLLTALNDGKVAIWSHHQHGGQLSQFSAVHMAGDSVSYMTTDTTNTYLFTGTILGYLKIWLITNFGVPPSDHQRIVMPKLRLKFPFLLRTVFLGRAKRSVRKQPNPMLLSSLKCHTKAITGIEYVEKHELLLTSSSDHSVRLWTLGGRYIGTFGSPVAWNEIDRTDPTLPKELMFRIPPDIKREASFTTLHVLTDGATHSEFRKKVSEVVDDEEETAEQKRRKECIYGRRLENPVLGNHSGIPTEFPLYRVPPTLDKSLPYVPIYTHLDIPGMESQAQNCKEVEKKNTTF